MKEFIERERERNSIVLTQHWSDFWYSWQNAIQWVHSDILHLPSMTVCTCLTMISLAMAAGQSSTMCFLLSRSWVSSCRMKSRASSAVFIFLAVWIENVGEPNASCQMKVLISFLMTKVINLVKFNFHWSASKCLRTLKFKQCCWKLLLTSAFY